jgi:hypothetical protein
MPAVPREQRKQVHLAAQLPGIHNVTVWSDPRSGSQIAIESFVRLAQTAERGKFDFSFLAEGLRLREHQGHIYDLDIVQLQGPGGGRVVGLPLSCLLCHSGVPPRATPTHAC